MGISRHATARWEGDLKTGKGLLSTPQSGVMEDTRYAFSSRFGDEKGTNPEELIAAAHAGCFTMALSAKLADAGHPPTRLDTRADVDLSMDGGPKVSQIRLRVQAQVPGIIRPKPGRAYGAVESPRGLYSVYAVSDGGPTPYRFRMRDPSFVSLQAIPKLMPGRLVADTMAVMASFDPVMGGVDK